MTMDVRELVKTKARAARDAARTLALCPTKLKNDALGQMAHGLIEKTAALLEANRADVERARSRGAARAFLDRLALTETRLEEMAQGLREIAALPDPVGTVVEAWRRPSGIEISRVRVPLGVVGFVYESRPNVTADAAGLCVKSGNAVVLRGGSEAIESNTMIAAVLAKAVEKAGGPAEAIQFIDTTDREAVAVLLELDDLGDGGGLGHGVPRPEPGDPGRGRPRRGDRAHPPPRHGPRRGDRDQRPGPRAALHTRGGRGRRPRQRVDAARRRRAVRHGRRDGDLYLARPRPWPGRRPRADDDEVRRGRRWASEGIVRLLVPRASD